MSALREITMNAASSSNSNVTPPPEALHKVPSSDGTASPTSPLEPPVPVTTTLAPPLSQKSESGDYADMRTFQIVVAVGESDWGMGIAGTMPWLAAGVSLSGDMARFKEITTSVQGAKSSTTPKKASTGAKTAQRNAVIMGRLTYESLPQKFKPLPGRLNIVLSRQAQGVPGDVESPSSTDLLYCSSLEGALRLLAQDEWRDHVSRVFVIGGAQIYREAILSPQCEVVHVTTVHKSFKADVFFPHPDKLSRSFRVWCSTPRQLDNGIPTSFTCYVPWGGAQKQVMVLPSTDKAAIGNGNGASGSLATNGGENGNGSTAEVAEGLPRVVRRMHEEYQYLDLVRNIMGLGASKGDRTGTGTLSLFGAQMRFNLRHSFPLLTTKRVFWRGVVEELLWFVSGATNANLLREKGIHIWDGNGSRQFLDSLGFTDREEGDLGPVYGFQWRHFGAEYTDMHADYRGQGVDQLADVVDKLRNNPEDRRILLSAWNPAALHLMALPPCHLLSQFYVANGELTCQLYQRSCDMGLGVPFNIASYALLTCMLAHVCDLKPGELVHTLGDAHVYNNHIKPLEKQLLNQPRPFPVLRIARDVKSIDGFQASDFELVGYRPHKKIAMDMAV